jgi:hypothetical protein
MKPVASRFFVHLPRNAPRVREMRWRIKYAGSVCSSIKTIWCAIFSSAAQSWPLLPLSSLQNLRSREAEAKNGRGGFVLINGAEKFIECTFFFSNSPSTGRWLLVLCEKLLPAIVALEN